MFGQLSSRPENKCLPENFWWTNVHESNKRMYMTDWDCKEIIPIGTMFNTIIYDDEAEY